MWDPPWSEVKPMSPALAGRLLITGSEGKSSFVLLLSPHLFLSLEFMFHEGRGLVCHVQSFIPRFWLVTSTREAWQRNANQRCIFMVFGSFFSLHKLRVALGLGGCELNSLGTGTLLWPPLLQDAMVPSSRLALSCSSLWSRVTVGHRQVVGEMWGC